jgi:hypothetical protein
MLIAPFAFVIIAGIAALPIALAVKSWNVLGDMRMAVTWGCAIILMPVIWTLYRCLTDAHYWKTDTNCITQRSVLRRFSARWDQVDSVEMRTGLLGSRTYRINTSVGAITTPAAYGVFGPINLLASIRQYLVANGKPDIPSLPGSVLSLWYSIPDEVPRQMEWKCTQKTQWWAFALLFGMFVMFCALFFVESKEVDAVATALLAVFGIEIAAVTIYTLKNMTVGKYCISDESIAVHRKSKSITIPWAKVENASWKNNPNGGLGIFIRQNDPKRQILVPYDKKNDDSGRLILSIIRSLQPVGIYLPIPQPLRVSNPQPVNVSQDGVSLQLPRIVKYGATSILVMMGILPLLPPIIPRRHNNDDYWMVAFILALSALLGVAANVYRVCTDERGLHKRTIFGSKTIPWGEVGAYEKVFSNVGELGVYKIRLRGKHGKVIFQIESSNFCKPEWDAFVAYTDSKLGHLLADEDTKPWLARPYA